MRLRTRRLLVILAAVALVLVVARLALDPIVTWRTRSALDDMPGMRGRFSDVEVKVADLSYAIHDLRIEKRTAAGAALPFVEARRAKFGVLGKELLRGHVVARIDLDRPKLNLVQVSDAKEAPAKEGQDVRETPGIGRTLEKLAPFLVDRVQIRGGEILWLDAREPKKPRVWLHDIEATVENFATRAALARGEPTVLALRGMLQHSGRLSVFATADPLAKKLTFAGQGRLDGFRLAELGELLAAKQEVVPDKGTLEMSIRFRAAEGRLSGGIRPFLHDAGTRPAAPGLGAKVKSFLADASLEIFEDDVPGREAVATTIPITGRVDDPDLQLVPTILGVIRNAFVRGLADSVTGLPPPKAKDKEGVLEQARRALSPGRGKQPRAQPTENER